MKSLKKALKEPFFSKEGCDFTKEGCENQWYNIVHRQHSESVRQLPPATFAPVRRGVFRTGVGKVLAAIALGHVPRQLTHVELLPETVTLVEVSLHASH